jgi:hemerythrin-like domain-containing protein
MCSYCGCDSIDVVGRFMTEHTAIVNASGVLRQAARTGDLTAVRDAVDALGALLHPHTHAEEVGLFSVLREQEEFTDHVDRLCGEHDELDAMLDAIRAGDLRGLETFIDALRRHIDREDNGLFPASAMSLSGPDWERVVARTPAAPDAAVTTPDAAGPAPRA